MRNQYHHLKIEDIIEHSSNIRSFVFENVFSFESCPGQYVMLWLPGFDEKPFSLSASDRITIKKVGDFTEEIFKRLKKFDYLNIRGPYGHGCFPKAEKGVAIGGGMGIAPLMYLLESDNANIYTFIAAGKTKDDLIFSDTLNNKASVGRHLKNFVPVTEDGSYGIKGIVTDVDEKIYLFDSDTSYYVCGREAMMHAVAEKLVREGIEPSKIYLSLERYMKCGDTVGCGSCNISGYSVCSDGPVFSYDKILRMSDFGKKHRTRSGELVDL